MSADAALTPERPSQKELVEKLRAAFERAFAVIPRLPDTDQQYEVALHSLDWLYGPCLSVPAAFRPASAAATRLELQDIEKHAAALAEILRSLHEPAIVLLADAGFIRDDLVHGNLAAQAERAAAGATKALQLRNAAKKEAKGRPSQPKAHAAATMIVRAFRELTGENPATKAADYKEGVGYKQRKDKRTQSGALPSPQTVCMNLGREVFDILALDADAKNAIRKVLDT